MKAIIPILAFLLSATFPAHAGQFGLFTYKVTDGEITITDYPEDATGHVEIPAEIEGLLVTTIGGSPTRWGWDRAFSGCTELTSVSIPGSVRRIRQAFVGCSGLTEVFFAEGLTSIGSGAFRGCTSLTKVSIPSSIIHISLEEPHFTGGTEYAFTDCTQLAEILVAADNPNYSSVDGVLFDAEIETLLSFPKGKAGDYTVPEGVTTIRDSAFSGNTKLTSISLPSSVTNLRSGWQFFGYSLTSIVVDPENTSFSSANGVLFNAEMTNLLRFPEGKPGSYAIPEGVVNIDYGAFSDCSKLTSITLPSGLTRIRDGAFYNCSRLSKISIPSSVTSLGEGSFGNCSALESILIPASATTIESYAWAYFESLTSAVFLGDSPLYDPFESLADTTAFTIYYLSSSTGFTSPTWNGYRTVMLDEVTYPAAPWLVFHGFPQDTDLNQDLNGDGVSLLMAYALNLDLTQDLSSSLPRPILDGNGLSLRFHAGASGITYSVETSTDLQHWTRDGVSLVDSGDPQRRRASVEVGAGGARFLRLVVG
ncbi:MAG: leucine-rich repeat domain-containing protein, partial [Verrucomicrobiales bacterium]